MRRLITIKIIGFLLMTSAVLAQNQLLIPPSLSGTNINLTLQNGTHQFLSGTPTNTMGANGNILGPTLILNKGDLVNFSVNNQLGENTTIHWHGLHVAPENDGGPHTVIADNTTWQPTFEIMDRAATYWYHPHLHHKTDEHVTKGIAGLIIVKDSDEAALALPRTYGVDDFPLVIQTKDFDANNQVMVHSNSDDIAMVNATIDGILSTPAQVVRCRVLNGSSQRIFNLGLSGNQTFYQIASDGGLLAAPITLTRLKLAPGERAEILIDFSNMNGQTVQLKSYASELPNGNYGATNPGMGQGMTLTGYNPNPLNGANFDLMTFNIGTSTANPITSIPTTLVTVNPIPQATVTNTRTITFTSSSMGMNALNGDFLFNNQTFDMGVVNQTVILGSTEIWTLTNQSPIAHPFHIHDVQFNILDRGGVAPAANEQGWKDVVLVNPMETVRFIAKFEDFANDTIPYMYHCHMLVHEDGGMMGQFIVTDTSTVNTATIITAEQVAIFPNPTNGMVTININGVDNFKVNVYGIDGKLLMETMNKEVDLTTFPQGFYVFKIIANQQVVTKQVVKVE
jgi:bilirubin oxidase